jgi:polyhydroxyalkanoate synthesis regulator phasin
MVMDALRGYVQLASGLTEVTKQRAQAAAKALLQQTGADALTSKVSELADEIVATSKSNRQLLQAIVANEVEGAVARLGFVRSEEVAALTRRVQALETELAGGHVASPAAPLGDAPLGDAAVGDAPLGDAPLGDELLEDELLEEEPGSDPVAKQAAAKKSAAKKAAKKPAAKTAKKA